MIALGLLVVIWLFAEIAYRMGRDEDRWDDAYQWKLRRKIERDGQKQRYGARDRR
jgi:hypothetical protein